MKRKLGDVTYVNIAWMELCNTSSLVIDLSRRRTFLNLNFDSLTLFKEIISFVTRR